MNISEWDILDDWDENTKTNAPGSIEIRNKNDISCCKGHIKNESFDEFIQQLQTISRTSRKCRPKQLSVANSVYTCKSAKVSGTTICTKKDSGATGISKGSPKPFSTNDFTPCPKIDHFKFNKVEKIDRNNTPVIQVSRFAMQFDKK